MFVLIAGCSATPVATPTITARPTPPTPRIAIDAAPAPTACLPTIDHPEIDSLFADEKGVHVCFGANACVAIDRRTSAITPWTPDVRVVMHHHTPHHVTIERERLAHETDICADNDCVSIPSWRFDQTIVPLSGDRDDAGTRMVLTLRGESPSSLRFVILDEGRAGMRELKGAAGGPCGSAAWAGRYALVTTDDCEGGSGSSALFDTDGTLLALIGAGRVLDTSDAFWVDGGRVSTIVAPRAYALVLVDQAVRWQRVVDLVPIQAEATSTPAFEAKPLPDGNWVVASATGGVGIVDRTSLAFEKTWIVPRCDAATSP
jgi:hypothetical protein